MPVRMWRKKGPDGWLVGIEAHTAATEATVVVPQATTMHVTLLYHFWEYIQRSLSQYTDDTPAYPC